MYLHIVTDTVEEKRKSMAKKGIVMYKRSAKKYVVPNVLYICSLTSPKSADT